MTLSTSSSANEPVRIGGFYSSFDTQAVVKALAAVAQAPIASMQKKQDALQQKSLIVARLQTEIATLLSTANRMLLPDSVSAKTATVTGTGVTASARSNAATGTFNVSVLQVATSTTATGSALTAPLDAASPLNSSNFGTPVTAGSFTIKTGQGTAVVSVDPATQSLNDVIDAINAQSATTGVTASLSAGPTGQLDLLDLQSAAGPIQLGTGADTSNFLAATNLLASPGTSQRTSTLAINRINLAATMSAASFLGGPPASGPHTFTINGVNISYDASSDSLGAVVARINSSGAGVRAAYDSNTDRITLTQSAPGSLGIQLADDGTGGDFLARTGLLSALQVPGQNAQYSINGGPVVHSTSNTVDLGNGVTLTLAAPTGASTATVTVAQDSASAAASLASFASDYNKLMDDLAEVTKADRTNPGALSGDSNLISLRTRLKGMISNPGVNVSGRFGQLASIGLSFGPIGSAPGTTSALVFDAAVFNSALASDPAGVQAALSQITITPALLPGGTSSVTGMSGSYAGKIAGTYTITSDGLGNLTAVLAPSDGTASITTTATVTAGSSNTTLLPGMTLTIGALQAGTTTITANTSSQSVISQVKDFLNGLVGPRGTFKNLQDEYSNVIKSLEARKAQVQKSVDAQVAMWQHRFSLMEQAQARASQVSTLLAQRFQNNKNNN